MNRWDVVLKNLYLCLVKLKSVPAVPYSVLMKVPRSNCVMYKGEFEATANTKTLGDVRMGAKGKR